MAATAGPGHSGTGGSRSEVTTTSALDEGTGTGVGSATDSVAGVRDGIAGALEGGGVVAQPTLAKANRDDRKHTSSRLLHGPLLRIPR